MPPDGWAICDGTNGTPNLTERFIRGSLNRPTEKSYGGMPMHHHEGVTDPTSKQMDTADLSYSAAPGVISTHRHHYVTNDVSNLPPYWDLFFIMKL
jgi:hypothetical protein